MSSAQRTETFFTVNEIAAFLGVSRRTIYRWQALRIVYRRASVDAWLKRNESAEVR